MPPPRASSSLFQKLSERTPPLSWQCVIRSVASLSDEARLLDRAGLDGDAVTPALMAKRLQTTGITP
jgi:hypothetical protein